MLQGSIGSSSTHPFSFCYSVVTCGVSAGSSAPPVVRPCTIRQASQSRHAYLTPLRTSLRIATFVHPLLCLVHLSVSPLCSFTSTLSSSSDRNSDVQLQPPGWSPHHPIRRQRQRQPPPTTPTHVLVSSVSFLTFRRMFHCGHTSLYTYLSILHKKKPSGSTTSRNPNEGNYI